jgi:hypothetical protein
VRGCLSVMVLAIVFIVAGAWLAGPPAAALVVEAGLSAAGFHGTDTSVTVAADPPLEVLTAHADRVEIESNDVTVRQFGAARLSLTLTDADLLNRRFGHVEGTLDDATLQGSGGSSLKATSVELSGDPSAAAMTVRVARDELSAMALEMIGQQLGVDVETVKFSSPDRVSFSAGRTTIAGRLVIHEGGLAMTVNLPGAQRIDLIEASPGFRLTKVSVGTEEMVLDGVLDVDAMLS